MPGKVIAVKVERGPGGDEGPGAAGRRGHEDGERDPRAARRAGEVGGGEGRGRGGARGRCWWRWRNDTGRGGSRWSRSGRATACRTRPPRSPSTTASPSPGPARRRACAWSRWAPSSRRSGCRRWRARTRSTAGCAARRARARRCWSPTARASRPRGDAGVREIAVFTAASETFSRKNTNAAHRRDLRPLRRVRARGARGRDVGARLRLHLLRLPVRGAGGPRARGRRGGAAGRPRLRRDLDRRHHRRGRADPGGGRGGPAARGDPAREAGRPLPRHARHRARQRGGRAAGGRRGRGQLGGRPRRLPVRAGGERQPRHRGPALHAARDGHRDRGGPGRGGGRVARPRPAPRPRAAQPLPAGDAGRSATPR